MAVKTHIGKIREQYTYNRQCILTALDWDEDTYNNSWIDMGSAYVASQYPAEDPRYVVHHLQTVNDRRYWQWWLLEWKIREAIFVRQFCGKAITSADFEYAMLSLLVSYDTDKSFEQNYLKV